MSFPGDNVVQGTGTVGGGGGSSFWQHQISQGAVVKTITVWKDNGSGGLRCVRLVFTNGQTFAAGLTTGPTSSSFINFAPAEKITKLSLWGNGIGTRCGRIRFETSKGQIMDWGKNTNGQTEYPMQVGSGILAGIYGNAGSDIDNLGLIFVKPVRSVTVNIADADWINDPINTGTGIGQVDVAVQKYSNPGDEKITWSFNGEREVANTTTYTQSSSDMYGVSAKVSAGLFDIVTVETSFQWSRTTTKTTETSTTTSFKVGATIGGELAPKAVIQASTIAQLGALNLNYNAQVTLRTESGDTVSYSEAGVFENSLFAYGESTYKQLPPIPTTENKPVVNGHTNTVHQMSGHQMSAKA